MFRKLVSWFRKSNHMAAAAHMTFAHTSAGRTITRTGALLRRNVWLWPLLAVLALSAVGYSVSQSIRATMKHSIRSELQTLLNVQTSMLETWLRVQQAGALSEANDRQVREAVEQLVQFDESPPADAKALPELMAQLTRDLSPGMTSHDFVGYFVTNREQKILASSSPELVGMTIAEFETFIARALDGRPMVSPPFPGVSMMKDDKGHIRTGVPTMFVSAPVRDNGFQVVGAIAFRIRPEREFTRILQLGQIGDSGETYAFDKSAQMVSNSRFDDDLILLGLLPDQEGARSLLHLSIKDPGGNMLTGFRPKVRRSELPMTKMAASAIAGESGSDVEGYADYRGVPVVGAWKWLPEFDMGVATEVDRDEAYRPLTIVQWMFTGIYILLGICSIAIYIFSLVVARMQREAQRNAIEAKQLGQYVLGEKLGAGAMGIVYKAHHALLRRPTAVKLLNVDRVNDASIQRFEREVQITSQLNHPNTIAIYDYGRTPEGVFYYAMEYLDGIDLQELVDRYGPQPEHRVIKILTQICGSLYEAHSHGLVHRDIKPANIMLNRRGSEPDLIKVLDFGLVKAIDDEKQANLSSNGLTGTPLYMSPEAIQFPLSVDARSDIYAVGAVGYFLLTGQTVFSATSLVELCRMHVAQAPVTPSERLQKPVSDALEHALLACLDKNSARRPQTARDLALMIGRAPTAHSWTIDEADAWWGRHERNRDSGYASLAGSSPTGRGSATETGPSSGGSSSSTRRAAHYDQTLVRDQDEI